MCLPIGKAVKVSVMSELQGFVPPKVVHTGTMKTESCEKWLSLSVSGFQPPSVVYAGTMETEWFSLFPYFRGLYHPRLYMLVLLKQNVRDGFVCPCFRGLCPPGLCVLAPGKRSHMRTVSMAKGVRDSRQPSGPEPITASPSATHHKVRPQVSLRLPHMMPSGLGIVTTCFSAALHKVRPQVSLRVVTHTTSDLQVSEKINRLFLSSIDIQGYPKRISITKTSISTTFLLQSSQK